MRDAMKGRAIGGIVFLRQRLLDGEQAGQFLFQLNDRFGFVFKAQTVMLLHPFQGTVIASGFDFQPVKELLIDIGRQIFQMFLILIYIRKGF